MHYEIEVGFYIIFLQFISLILALKWIYSYGLGWGDTYNFSDMRKITSLVKQFTDLNTSIFIGLLYVHFRHLSQVECGQWVVLVYVWLIFSTWNIYLFMESLLPLPKQKTTKCHQTLNVFIEFIFTHECGGISIEDFICLCSDAFIRLYVKPEVLLSSEEC